MKIKVAELICECVFMCCLCAFLQLTASIISDQSVKEVAERLCINTIQTSRPGTPDCLRSSFTYSTVKVSLQKRNIPEIHQNKVPGSISDNRTFQHVLTYMGFWSESRVEDMVGSGGHYARLPIHTSNLTTCIVDFTIQGKLYNQVLK